MPRIQYAKIIVNKIVIAKIMIMHIQSLNCSLPAKRTKIVLTPMQFFSQFHIAGGWMDDVFTVLTQNPHCVDTESRQTHSNAIEHANDRQNDRQWRNPG